MMADQSEKKEVEGAANEETTGKKMKNGKEDKLCLVCGDRALGCNFDAISCESCKAFFRRNALKEKVARCLFESKCVIDVRTRRFCSYCRLQKCFTAGMKKDFILDEKEKRKRREKVLENRNKKIKTDPEMLEPSESSSNNNSGIQAQLNEPNSPLLSPGSLDGDQYPPQSTTAPVYSSSDLQSPVSIQAPPSTTTDTPSITPVKTTPLKVVSCDRDRDKIQSISSPSSPESGKELKEVMSAQNMAALAAAQSQNAAASGLFSGLNFQASFAAISGASPTLGSSGVEVQLPKLNLAQSLNAPRQKRSMVDWTNQTRQLTTAETAILIELETIYEATISPFAADSPITVEDSLTINNLVNVCDNTVRRLIKFAKRFDDFVRLNQDTQIKLLKGAVLNALLLRSVSAYDPDRDVWLTPSGEVPTAILKAATSYYKLHDEHVAYCKSMKELLQDDVRIIIILLVISLFSPECPFVSCREEVSNIQDRYVVLLKHYLEANYSYQHAKCMFPQVLLKLGELKQLGERHAKVLLEVDPKEIEPLMLEIFDLK
ncbi:unnamed protein product [Owenia fusiformis]|uniref:Uncharacterized protein n=1 Tax=Owenia fusiformis TaxID=6347 RepID=A0A8J1XH12_OWEFU|nr:unnamed protein product [Owenia fusiformis]